jgi:TonB-dependent starch-binding outer membrane protein SusC
LSQYTYFFPRKRFRNCLQSVKGFNNNLIQNKGSKFRLPNQKTKYMNVRLLARRLKYAALLFVLPFFVNAQQKTVTGKVTSDKDGSAISGATVIAKGSTKGTQTAADGAFVIEVPAATKTLVISSVGSVTEQVSIGANNIANVSLKVGNEGLAEVVVVGYGSRKIKDATGSVAALSTKDFNKGVIATPEQLFQGRTPGVTVTPASGEPGAAATINIRGTSSIRGNNDPLYVVDGVPLDGGGTSSSASGIEGVSTPKNPLIFLNPNDIESISILKDASSAAIYGSRGANGVIIITTKNGKGKKGAFTFGATTSISKTASRYNLLSAQDFLVYNKKANIAAGTDPIAAGVAVIDLDKHATTDWQDEIFQTGVSQNYNLGWGFSNNGTSLRLSGSYDDQKGIVKSSGLKRVTGRANFSQNLLKDDRLKLNATLTYSNVKNQYAPNTNNAGFQGSLIGSALKFNPTLPVYNKDGSFYQTGGSERNPVEMIKYFDDRDNINRLLTNLSASYKIFEGLTFKSTFGYDNSKSIRKSFADPRAGGGGNPFSGSYFLDPTPNVGFNVEYAYPIFGNGRAIVQNLNQTTTLIEHTLTYDKIFNTKHIINAVGGYSYQSANTKTSSRFYSKYKTPLTSPNDVFTKDVTNFGVDSLGSLPLDATSYIQSFFGRVNYTYDDKYLLTATVRSDGSSKFGSNNKYGTFPAFAAKWKVLNEDFAKNSLGKIFTDFSIRANYGILGSQDGLDIFAAKGKFVTYYGKGRNQLQENPNLKWEQATTKGIGLDFAFKKLRLSGTVDYYSTNRKNIITFGPTPGGFSASSYYFSNLPGNVINKGLEFSLNLQPIKTKGFNWDINYNMTFLSNKLINFGNPINTGTVNGQGLSGAYAQTIANGYPLFTWKMPIFAGFDGNGNQRFADNDPSDKLVGSALPTFTAGVTNNFSLGRWNASIFLNGSAGFYVYNNTANALFLQGSLKNGNNITYEAANSPENPINPGSVSTRFLEKGDFIRLSNAILSYNFDVKSKIIKSFSASVSGQNLALWTKYSGLDPEVNVDKNINGFPSRGFDYAGYPKARTVSFGINVGF